jgi:hypothetical protein
MKNEYIEVVKRWLADKDSVSQEELKANAKAAADASSKAADASSKAADAAMAAIAADGAADWAAADAAWDADAAALWVKRYEEVTRYGNDGHHWPRGVN